MIQIAICDDEPAARSALADLIRRQGLPCAIREYGSARALLEDPRQADLLFLDVRLGEGEDGMELARTLRERLPEPRPAVIFVSGYEQYVFDAFDVGAFQYLLKPVDPERFARVFARAAEWVRRREEAAPRALLLQSRGISRRVDPEHLCYAESRGHTVTLHLREEEPFSCYARLGDLEAELGPDFCRIHKGYLVNLQYVESCTRTSVRLSGGAVLPVSKYKYAGFRQAHLRYLRRGAGL